jgi:CrcB protein
MRDFVLVSLGAILGAIVRWIITLYSTAQKWTPYSTIGINITGSFLLGIITKLGLIKVLSPSAVLLLGTGFCGAYTTFSTYSVDVLKSIEANNYSQALTVVGLSNTLGIAFAFLGYKLV